MWRPSRRTWLRVTAVLAIVLLHELSRRHLADVDLIGAAVSGNRFVLLVVALMFLARFAILVVVPGWLAATAVAWALERSSNANEQTDHRAALLGGDDA